MNNKKINTLAALGFAISFFYSIPGIVFSIIGLNQIKRYNEDGKVFSILGIIISIVRILLIIVVIILLLIYSYNNREYWNVDLDSDRISLKDKCRSYSTSCSAYEWECSRSGCYCKYDNGYYEEEIYCPSYYFD